MYKKIVLSVALAMSVMCAAGSSHAGSMLEFDMDGLGGAGPNARNDFVGFDWFPGNTLADGGNQAVSNFVSKVGSTTFDLFYQARITNTGKAFGTAGTLTYGIGGSSAPAKKEFTIVAGFREKVTGIAPDGTATFDFVAGEPNFLEVYFDDVNANDLAGTGFNNGTLILSANVTGITSSNFKPDPTVVSELDGFGADDYVGLETIKGGGGTNLTAAVSFVNPDFFYGASMAGLNVTFKLDSPFEGTQGVPFDVVNPSARFVKAAGGVAPVLDGAGLYVNDLVSPSLGAVNGSFTGTGGPDVQFKSDSNQSFQITAVPEPASLAIWALGFAFLPTLRTRRA